MYMALSCTACLRSPHLAIVWTVLRLIIIITAGGSTGSCNTTTTPSALRLSLALTRAPSCPPNRSPHQGQGYAGSELGGDGEQAIGAVRVHFEQLAPARLSILAMATPNGQLEPFKTLAGDSIVQLTPKTLTAEQMFAQLRANNQVNPESVHDIVRCP